MPGIDYAALADQARQAAPPMDYAALAAQARQSATPRKAPVDLERRQYANIIGIDFDWIADHASRLPAALQKPVAAAAAFLGSVLQDVSSPENVATLGVGGR